MNWFDEAWKHLQLLNHRHTTHIRAYGNWGGKKYYIPSGLSEHDTWMLLSPIYGKHFNDNTSVGIADLDMDKNPASWSVIVFDFDRAEKDRLDGKYLSHMSWEVHDFVKFMALKGFKNASVLFSGTGFHVYYPIPTIPATQRNIEKIQEFEEMVWKEFVEVAKPEHIVADLQTHPGKLMRLAGTYNRKAGRPRMAQWLIYRGYVPDHKLLHAAKL